MQKTLNPTPMRPVMEDGGTGFSDFRTRVYASPQFIEQYTTLSKSNGGRSVASTLSSSRQRLRGRPRPERAGLPLQLPVPSFRGSLIDRTAKSKEKVIDTKYVNTEKARSVRFLGSPHSQIIDTLCIETLLDRWCDNLRRFFYSQIKSHFVSPVSPIHA